MEYEISKLVTNAIRCVNIVTAIIIVFGIINVIVELRQKQYKFSIALILAAFNYMLIEGYNADVMLYKELIDSSTKIMINKRIGYTELLILLTLAVSSLWIVFKIVSFLIKAKSIQELKKLRSEELAEINKD